MPAEVSTGQDYRRGSREPAPCAGKQRRACESKYLRTMVVVCNSVHKSLQTERLTGKVMSIALAPAAPGVRLNSLRALQTLASLRETPLSC